MDRGLPFTRPVPTLSQALILYPLKENVFKIFIYFQVDHCKVFIEFVTILLLFYILVFWLWGMWGLNLTTRDWICTPCIGWWSLHPWTSRQISAPLFLHIFSHLKFLSFLNNWSIVGLQCFSFKCTPNRCSCTCIYIYFQILFLYRLLQNIEYNSLCNTVGSYCLFILYKILC